VLVGGITKTALQNAFASSHQGLQITGFQSEVVPAPGTTNPAASLATVVSRFDLWIAAFVLLLGTSRV